MVSFRQMRGKVRIGGFHAHHLIPKQISEHRHFAQFIGNLRGAGLDLDDFEENGMHLPCTQQLAEIFQLPVHRGAHPRYNALVADQVGKLENLPIHDALLGIRSLQCSLRSGLRYAGPEMIQGLRNPMASEFERDLDSIGLLSDRRARIVRVS